jgi:hypothetical protein
MNERGSDDIDDDDIDDVEDDEDAVVEDDDDDDIDLTGEVNIESLVAKLDSTPKDDLERKRAIRRRLEELRDMREAERDLDSTYNFNLDDEL